MSNVIIMGSVQLDARRGRPLCRPQVLSDDGAINIANPREGAAHG